MRKRIFALLLAVVLFCADGGNVLAQAGWETKGQSESKEYTGYFGVRQIPLEEAGDVPACGAFVPAESRARSEWDIYASNYYYNMLEGDARTFYEDLDAVCFEYLTKERDAAEDDRMSGVPCGSLTEQERGEIYNLFRYANPQYYFLTSSFYYDTQGMIYPVLYPAFADGAKRKLTTEIFLEKIEAALEQIGSFDDAYSTELAIHNWLIANASYDYDYTNLEENELYEYEMQNGYTQSCYSVFCKEDGETLCAGYTQAFGLLCNAAGLDVIAVTSNNHAWNQIRINGSWYLVDCTWNDMDDGIFRYNYFNRSTEKLGQMDSNDFHVCEAYYQEFLKTAQCTSDSGASENSPGRVYEAKGTAQAPGADWEMIGNKIRVTLTAPDEGAGIYYTTDGMTPSAMAAPSKYYRGPFTVEYGTTIKAITIVDGYFDSEETVVAEFGYPVNYDLQDGRTESQFVKIGERLQQPSDPQREGYSFGGWYQERTCETEWDFENGMLGEGLTLYAKWVPKVYRIYFDMNSGTMDPTVMDVTHGELFGRLPVPQRYGHVFVGWYTEVAGGRLITENSLVTQTTDLVLYAHWKIVTCEVVFEMGNGEKSLTVDVVPGERLAEPDVPQREGYSFGGWYTDFEQEKSWSFEDVVQEEHMTLYARWIPNTYRIFLDPNGGVISDGEKEAVYMEKYGDLIEPKWLGYTFLGWYTKPSGGMYVTKDTLLDKPQDVYLYAHWEERLCTIIFEKQNGAAPDIQKIRYGTVPVCPKEPRREGYHFEGWYLEDTYETAWDFERAMETEQLVVYAKWQPNIYKVILDVNGGSGGIIEKDVFFAERIGTLFVPVRAEYAFGGWSTLPLGGETVTENTVLTQAGDLHLFAQWIPRTYRIIYYLDGGTNDKRNPLSYNVVSPGSVLYAPSKKGSVFAGWYADAAMRVNATVITKGTTGDLPIYAKWEKVTVEKAVIKKLSSTRAGRMKVRVKAVDAAVGYEIRYAAKSNLKNAKIRKLSSLKKTFTKLKKGKKYYVQVRAYKIDSTGEKVYGKWSRKKSIRILK